MKFLPIKQGFTDVIMYFRTSDNELHSVYSIQSIKSSEVVATEVSSFKIK